MTGNRDITYPSPPSITGPVHDQHSITNTLRSRDTLARRARLTRSRLCQLLDDDLQYLRHCPARFNERRVVASQSLDVGTFATLCLDVAAGYCPRSLSLSFYSRAALTVPAGWDVHRFYGETRTTADGVTGTSVWVLVVKRRVTCGCFRGDAFCCRTALHRARKTLKH